MLRRRQTNRGMMTLPEALSGSVGFLLSKAAEAMRERFEGRLRQRKLTAPQVGILTCLAHGGGATQRELGAALRIDRTTMVHLLDRLEEMRLLRRQDNTADRRSYVVQITPRGRSTARRALADAARVERELLRELPEKDRRTLRRILGQMLETEHGRGR